MPYVDTDHHGPFIPHPIEPVLYQPVPANTVPDLAKQPSISTEQQPTNPQIQPTKITIKDLLGQPSKAESDQDPFKPNLPESVQDFQPTLRPSQQSTENPFLALFRPLGPTFRPSLPQVWLGLVGYRLNFVTPGAHGPEPAGLVGQ